MKKTNIYIIILALLLLVIACRPDRQQGVHAPDFSLVALDGSTVQLSKLLGKVVLVNFWATWCPPCIKEMPMFQEVFEQYEAKGFTIIGVSMDNTAKIAKKFADRMEISYPVVMGSEKLGAQYKVTGLPTSFVLDRQGTIVQEYIGPPSKARLVADIQAALE